MAQIPLPGGPGTQYYTVETRKFAGYDQSPQSVPLEGVLIHFVDTTLGDKRAQVVGVPCNGAGAQWVPGELFEDTDRVRRSPGRIPDSPRNVSTPSPISRDGGGP